jgi:hypothetical protein
MRKDRKASFDPKSFLAKVGEGKAIAKYQKSEESNRLLAGRSCGCGVCIQKGQVKLTVATEGTVDPGKCPRPRLTRAAGNKMDVTALLVTAATKSRRTL